MTRSLNLKPDCYKGLNAGLLYYNAVYQLHQCGATGKGAEAIAQARYIYGRSMASQSIHYYSGINPGIQWEMSLPDGSLTRRSDIVEYNPNPTPPIQAG
ncbi:hypothetical protein [Arthrobacter ramosus]|uniref:hypothetical protein n=1 Tax=Arthrobacter ramosus TaxID=1672 RepID=UPI001F18381C|nr:hypothetical protein [Arthrobacter ramosus]